MNPDNKESWDKKRQTTTDPEGDELHEQLNIDPQGDELSEIVDKKRDFGPQGDELDEKNAVNKEEQDRSENDDQGPPSPFRTRPM